MRVTVVGSSDAFNSAGRCHSCYWIDGPEEGAIMVDFGATALSAVRRIGKDPRNIRAIVVTHLHGDHIGGFPYLIIDGMFNAVRNKTLDVVGPVGTKKRIHGFAEIAYGDVVHKPRPYDLNITEIEPGQECDLLGLKVRGFAASHMDPPEKPLCIRIENGERSIAFSGDTEMCDGLFDAARGADLLVAECSAMRPPAGRHCTWIEWEKKLPTIGAKTVVLSHLNQEMRDNIPELVKQQPDGVTLAFAEDGLEIDY